MSKILIKTNKLLCIILIITISVCKNKFHCQEQKDNEIIPNFDDYNIMKLNLNYLKINNFQLLTLLDSLIKNEIKCRKKHEYDRFNYYWMISYWKENDEKGYLLRIALNEYIRKENYLGFFKVNNAIIIVSKTLKNKNLFVETKKKKKFKSKVPKYNDIIDLPSWIIYYSYSKKNFYIVHSEFECE